MKTGFYKWKKGQLFMHTKRKIRAMKIMALTVAIVMLFISFRLVTAEEITDTLPQLDIQVTFSDLIIKDGLFTATVNVTNNTGPDENVTAIMAVYDETGKIKTVVMDSRLVAGQKTEVFALAARLENTKESWYPKVFVWHGDKFDKMIPAAEPFYNFPSSDEIISIVKRVNNYWISTHPNHENYFWDKAAYHTGNMEAYYLTGDENYRKYSIGWANRNNWSGPTANNWNYQYGENNVLFGDCQICFQTYIDLYNLEPSENKVSRAKYVMGYQIGTSNVDYLWWVDGLYMVMPVMTKMYHLTGDRTYLDKMYQYYKYAKDLLYDDGTYVDANGNNGDVGNGLWYRDAKYVYPDRNYNGQKEFWSRGNGWAVAAHVKVLQDLPDDDPHREEYIQTFKEMMAALIPLQQPEGYWTRSLLIPEQAPGPESSGTMFFLYGMAYGIRSGILDKETYLPYLLKGWNWLITEAVSSEGVVGYVQPIGENPQPGTTVSKNSTANFGVGAFLLLGSEMAKLNDGIKGDGLLTTLKKRMVNANALKIGSPYVIVNNAVKYADSENTAAVPVKNGNRVLIPLSFFTENYSITAEKSAENGKILISDGSMETEVSVEDIHGIPYVMADEMAQAIRKKVFRYNDLIVMSHQEKPFYIKYEKSLLNYLDSIIASGDYPSLPSYDGETKLPEPSETMIIVPPENVTASGGEVQNPAVHTVDRNYATRWSAETTLSGSFPNFTFHSQYITFDLGNIYNINKVGISFYNGHQRRYQFKIQTSVDGINFTDTKSDMYYSSGTTELIEYYTFNTVSAKYVRLDCYGYLPVNSWGWAGWNSITEVEIHKAQ